MEVELREDGGTLQVVADLYPITGEVGAELVLKDYTLVHQELDEDGYVAVYEDLVFRMMALLARLDIPTGGGIRLQADPTGSDPELDRAMERAIRSCLENTEEVLQRLIEKLRDDLERPGNDIKWLLRVMQEGGLRRGINKEARKKKADLGELFDLDE